MNTGPAWFVPVAMIALAVAFDRARPPREFTVEDLLRWAPDLRRLQTVRLACKTMQQGGLLTVAESAEPYANRNPHSPRWTLTDLGLQACRAARTEARTEATSRKRAATMTAVNKQRAHPHALPARLWNLFRIRKMLTSTEAACVLADAGDDVQALRKQIGHYLSGWQKVRPDAIEISQKRIDRSYRYVLAKDIGTRAPSLDTEQGAAA